jgi:uncharacterized protein with GYD domain
MPKYLIEASYTADGLKGLQKDKASGRKAAVTKALEAVGGKLDHMYFCLGDNDVVAVIDVPDLSTATALAVSISASGLVRTKTIPMMTVDEMDSALAKTVSYAPPGSAGR